MSCHLSHYWVKKEKKKNSQRLLTRQWNVVSKTNDSPMVVLQTNDMELQYLIITSEINKST